MISDEGYLLLIASLVACLITPYSGTFNFHFSSKQSIYADESVVFEEMALPSELPSFEKEMASHRALLSLLMTF